MKREQVYTAVGVGVGFGLLGLMLWALDKSQRGAGASASSGGGTGVVQPRDPWAATRTQLNLLQVARNNFAALAASALPAGTRVLSDADALINIVQGQFFMTMGTVPSSPRQPPPPVEAVRTYSGFLAMLNTDAASIATWDAVTAQSVGILVAQANTVLATALQAQPSAPQGNA